ncbi:MAG: TonB family protein [Cetobacterium sp.]|uniref:TonB family protein n=2 Tax=Cetobacterium sp. TaxID=2071632 RepID=UPI002FC92164
MIKFYLASIIVHLIIIGVGFKILNPKELKFVEKKNMIVSVQNQRAISKFQEVNSNKSLSEEKVKEEVKEESIKEVAKEEIKPKEEKLVKKIEKKESIKKVVNKKTVAKKVEKEKIEKSTYNEFQDRNRFIQGTDGVFTAVYSEGIEFEILKEVDPSYPIRAKKIGYKGLGNVNVKFLVNLDGKISEIIFLNGEMGYGFKEEVEKALKNWRFKPIEYKGKIIKVYFEKEFKFRVK